MGRQSSVGEVLQFSQSVSEVAKTNITFETKAMFLPQGNLPAHTASRFRVESKRVQNQLTSNEELPGARGSSRLTPDGRSFSECTLNK